jgi:hypothetical protein
MLKDHPQAPPSASSEPSRRGRLSASLLALVVALGVVIGLLISRESNDPSSLPSDQTTGGVTTSTPPTATTISTRTEIVSRLREILQVRDRALLERDAELLSGIYTIDCECLQDGRTLISQLLRENIVWKGVRTDATVRSAEEVNNRLWVVIATIRTPSVRIETEGGRLVRMVPPERNLVRFALARPQNEEEWLLGHASTFD